MKKTGDWIMITTLGVAMIVNIVGCRPKDSGKSNSNEVSSSVVEGSEAKDSVTVSNETALSAESRSSEGGVITNTEKTPNDDNAGEKEGGK